MVYGIHSARHYTTGRATLTRLCDLGLVTVDRGKGASTVSITDEGILALGVYQMVKATFGTKDYFPHSQPIGREGLVTPPDTT